VVALAAAQSNTQNAADLASGFYMGLGKNDLAQNIAETN